MKQMLFLLLIASLCFSGVSFTQAQGVPPGPVVEQERAKPTTAESPAPKAKKKTKSTSSPKEQIKEGGKEVGRGFKNMGLGIGKGFQNMGKGIKKAWTGDS
jgi:hypothetical protein